MSSAEEYATGYRVKFVDIRVNPPGGRRKPRERAAEVRRCEHKGCDDIGDCKAPKPFAARAQPVPGQRIPSQDDYWFCRRHAAEYNQSYDFFDGMTEAEITAFQASATYGHKRTWRMGGGPMGGAKSSTAHNPNRWRGRGWFDNAQDANERGPQARDRTRLQTRALDELELPHNATGEQVREKYGILIKRFHPDSNGGDRSMEGKLNLVIRAYKALKSAGLA
jgi:hypothetical protein